MLAAGLVPNLNRYDASDMLLIAFILGSFLGLAESDYHRQKAMLMEIEDDENRSRGLTLLFFICFAIFAVASLFFLVKVLAFWEPGMAGEYLVPLFIMSILWILALVAIYYSRITRLAYFK